MDAAADRMARRADELKKISEAAKPLYGSLDDTQKHKFELLGSEMMMAASGPIGERCHYTRDFNDAEAKLTAVCDP
jgi:hypothetical protein